MNNSNNDVGFFNLGLLFIFTIIILSIFLIIFNSVFINNVENFSLTSEISSQYLKNIYKI